MDIAKAATVLRAVQLTQELDFCKIILEGDAFQVIQAMRKEDQNWNHYGHLIEEAHEVLSCMHKWQVSHVSYNFNEAAHRLAKITLTINVEHILIEEAPTCIF